MIDRVKIVNFKSFKGEFNLQLNEGLNIIVGDNEAGKSTILEAIHLALTGNFNGRHIRNEISQYLFNKEVVELYLENINSGQGVELPYILIEIYFKGDGFPLYEGNGNSDKQGNVSGITFRIAFKEDYQSEYETLIKLESINSLPIEYYDVSWTSFARDNVTPRLIPIKSALIDSSSARYQNGSDIYVSRIVKDTLQEEDIVNISQAHRKMRENFMKDHAVSAINEKISGYSRLSDKKVELSVDLSSKNAWEGSLVTELNNIPFQYIGKGEQSIVKTELALGNKQSKNASIILIEEPENHLSYSKLNQLVRNVKHNFADKQILITTHSSFVANKLGLNNLILLNNHQTLRLSSLNKGTKEFFEKIAGYDTLRLILCKKAILVEGDSDELIVQKAYMKTHDGYLPIEDGIDIISTGVTFLRFLEIADILQKPTVVVTDNDGDIEAINTKYKNYIGDQQKPHIKICVDRHVDTEPQEIDGKKYNCNTLEPKLLKVNSLDVLNRIFGTNHESENNLRSYMKRKKTECAFKIYNSDEDIVYPDYILEAIKDE